MWGSILITLVTSGVGEQLIKHTQIHPRPVIITGKNASIHVCDLTTKLNLDLDLGAVLADFGIMDKLVSKGLQDIDRIFFNSTTPPKVKAKGSQLIAESKAVKVIRSLVRKIQIKSIRRSNDE